MDVPERPQEIKERLSDLFWTIEEDLEAARKMHDTLRSTIGEDPDLVRASVHIHRKEIIGE